MCSTQTHFYKTIFSPWLVQPWMRSLWQLPKIMFHCNYLQFDLPVFFFKVNHTVSIRTIIKQHLAERPKEENHNQGFSRLTKTSPEVCHKACGWPFSHSLRLRPWMPAFLLNSESTRAETVYFIYLPWPALEKVLQHTKGMTKKKSNIVVRQQIQEKIWEITWRLCEFMATAK